MQLGWRLNFWDAATKTLAFAGRMKLRDYLDVLFLQEKHLHVGALAWAAAAKDPGLSPEIIIDWGGRQARMFSDPNRGREIAAALGIDLPTLRRKWMIAADEAFALIRQLPPAELGCFYLDSTGRPSVPILARRIFRSHAALRQRARGHRRGSSRSDGWVDTQHPTPTSLRFISLVANQGQCLRFCDGSNPRRTVRSTVETLAALGERSTRRPAALNEAVDWVERELGSLGYRVERQAYLADGVGSVNLEARSKASIRPSRTCFAARITIPPTARPARMTISRRSRS